MQRSHKQKYLMLRLVIGTFISVMMLISMVLMPHVRAEGEPLIQESDLPLRVISWDITKAYPGIRYEYRLGVQGGEYPYRYGLLSAPEGLKIHETMGVITWKPEIESANHEISVQITDQKGHQINHTYTLDVSKENFCFVAANGNDQNSGTEDSPWASLAYAVKAATNNKFIYVKEGTYPIHLYIQDNDCGKLLAYPGDRVTLQGDGSGFEVIWLGGAGEYIFQGFECDANSSRWFFALDAPALSNLTIRKNHMFNIDDNSWENPSFLFTWDGPQTPILGQEHYKNILFQDNVVHDLRNPNDHGASAVIYDVQDMIFEDNIVYDIDGNGITDKDDGFRNTYRNNVFRECQRGIVLANQNTQGMINVHHNLIYNCPEAMSIGWQPGYLKDIFVHHNTFVGNLSFGSVINDNADCSNINVFNNIIGNGIDLPYQFVPIEATEGYAYPSYVLDPADETVRIDKNLIWSKSENEIAGYAWGLPAMNLDQWHQALYDVNGVVENPGLDVNYAIDPNSNYFGVYGRDHTSVPLPGTQLPEPPDEVYHTISFEVNGGTAVSEQTVAHDQQAVQPDEPVKDGFVFEGWYADHELLTPFDFATPIINNLTLYAKWSSTGTTSSKTETETETETTVITTAQSEPDVPTSVTDEPTQSTGTPPESASMSVVMTDPTERLILPIDSVQSTDPVTEPVKTGRVNESAIVKTGETASPLIQLFGLALLVSAGIALWIRRRIINGK